MKKFSVIFSICIIACLSACSLLPVGDADSVLNQAKQCFTNLSPALLSGSSAKILMDVGHQENDSIAVDFFDGSGRVIFHSNGSATWSRKVDYNPMSLDEKRLERAALRQVKWVTRKYGG